MIKTSDILPNPYQIRRNFEQNELELLAESIKEVGILSPIIVRRCAMGYELICGQRRHRAAIIAQIDEIPAIVIRTGDVQCAELSLIENIHRKNLSVFEESDGIYNLLLYHNVKKECLAKDISIKKGDLNEKVRFLSLPGTVRTKLEAKNPQREFIKLLLRIHNEKEQVYITNKIINEGISYSDAEVLVEASIKEACGVVENKPKKKKKPKGKLPLFENTVKNTVKLLEKYGAKVEFERKEDKNCVEYCIKTLK